MKNVYLVIFIFTCCLEVSAQNEDTLQVKNLPEVVVQNEKEIATPDRTIFLPTALDKKHATNGIELLGVMNLSELEIDDHQHNITTKNGGSVVLCIDGMEVSQEEVSMLRAKNIQSIQYYRTPGGKYAGKAGLLNFITIQYQYGGNVYITADEGFTYKQGSYLGYVDYTHKGLTLSLTTSFDWNRDHSYNEGQDNYLFADNTPLQRSYSSQASFSEANSQGIKFKLSSLGSHHHFSVYASFLRQAVPDFVSASNVNYREMFNLNTLRNISTHSRSISPSVYTTYTLWLPKNQTLSLTGSFTYGHNKYSSLYDETDQEAIATNSLENNHALMGRVDYSKALKHNYTFVASAAHEHNYYKDTYATDVLSHQRLQTDVTTGLLQIMKNASKYYFFLSAGISNTAVKLNDSHFNYAHPISFYGANYMINNYHSLSLNGHYTHTLFDPSNKNNMEIRKSFFEVVKGNPELSTLRALSNTLSYNGRVGNSSLSVSYDNVIYFDNISHLYSIDNQTIYDTKVNAGTFYGNMLTASYSYNAFNNKLRLNLTAIEEYNRLKGAYYNISKNTLRGRLSATYLLGEFQFKANFKTPYTTLFVSGPYFTKRKPVYELSVSWQHKGFAVEGRVRNPFSRFDRSHSYMDYGSYQKSEWSFSESNGRCLNLRLTYNLGYGKETEKGDVNINRTINNAILKAY